MSMVTWTSLCLMWPSSWARTASTSSPSRLVRSPWVMATWFPVRGDPYAKALGMSILEIMSLGVLTPDRAERSLKVLWSPGCSSGSSLRTL